MNLYVCLMKLQIFFSVVLIEEILYLFFSVLIFVLVAHFFLFTFLPCSFLLCIIQFLQKHLMG